MDDDENAQCFDPDDNYMEIEKRAGLLRFMDDEMLQTVDEDMLEGPLINMDDVTILPNDGDEHLSNEINLFSGNNKVSSCEQGSARRRRAILRELYRPARERSSKSHEGYLRYNCDAV